MTQTQPFWHTPMAHRARIHSTPRRAGRRTLRFEPLESRQLLAITDFAAISGRVFRDLNANGFDPGEQVANATVELFVDDGDGIFEPGAGDVAHPTQPTATSDVNGQY